jgi:hypothetical protein
LLEAQAMGMKLTQHQIEELCDYLRGTTNSFDDGMDAIGLPDVSLDELDREVLDEIDQSVFECSVCGWWCDTDELADDEDDNVCLECHPENEDEGD